MFQIKSHNSGNINPSRWLVLPAILLMSAGWAQAAVLDDTGQAKIAAPAVYVPAASGHVLTQWTGSENLCNYGPLTFQLYTGGRVVMIDLQATTDGTWQQVGQQITMSFGGGRVVYTGVMDDNAMSGTASNGQSCWSWSVGNVLFGTPVALPTQWAGSENLCNYGQLTFQFYDGGRVVMLDRQAINQGTFQQNGQQITMQFDLGRVQYTGTLSLNGNAMSGTAQNGYSSWSWNVNRLAG